MHVGARTVIAITATLAIALGAAGAAAAAPKGGDLQMILGSGGTPSVINSFQFGVGVGISTPGAGGGREISKPSFSEITVTRTTDPLSVELLESIATGTAYESVEIHIPAGPFVAAWCLSDVLLSGYSVSSGSGGSPSESLSLNYAGITQAVGTAFVTYDLASGATSSESLCS